MESNGKIDNPKQPVESDKEKEKEKDKIKKKEKDFKNQASP